MSKCPACDKNGAYVGVTYIECKNRLCQHGPKFPDGLPDTILNAIDMLLESKDGSIDVDEIINEAISNVLDEYDKNRQVCP